MIVWGGWHFDSNNVNFKGWAYEPETNAWRQISTVNAPRAALVGFTALWTGHRMMIWGGFFSDGFRAPTRGAQYDPSTDSWTPTSASDAPKSRIFHTALWTGNVMLVWGGRTNFIGPLGDTGGRYDPALDVWRPISLQNAPAPRNNASSVWTGREMIVWGGNPVNGGPYMQSGGRYNPISDSWMPVTSVNAPTTSFATAVWTGRYMVTWGGYDQNFLFQNTGDRYDPLTDTWSPTSTENAPVARGGHVALWSGREMLVWGGADSDGIYRNDGGRYDPTSDRWTSISLVNPPSPRADAVAVWTGSSMVIWGGHTNDSFLLPNTGGLYDPASDTWRATSTVDAPIGRFDPTVVWARNVMIVWGGFSNNVGFLNSGGRYDPVANSWTPMTTANAPIGRENHTAVWADRLMLIWGGGRQGSFNPLKDSGGGYSLGCQPPLVEVGEDIQAECSSPSGAQVVLDGSSTRDPDSAPGTQDDIASFEWFTGYGTPSQELLGTGAVLPATFPLGTSPVTLRVSDFEGGVGTDSLSVTVADTTPPHLAFTLDPAVLWPPNHRLVDFGVSIAASDACGSPSVILESIPSSEPDDAPGSGDGNTTGDVQGAQIGTADFAFQLRAERDGNGSGRTYLVTYRATDGSGNIVTATAAVAVPHDLGVGPEPLLLSARETTGGTILEWNQVPGALHYNVVRGNISSLLERSNFIELGTVVCLLARSTLTNTAGHEDAQEPAVGLAFFYLAAYDDGQGSGYGTASASKPRLSTGSGCD